MKPLEYCERRNAPVNLGGSMAEDIVTMCAAGTVVDDNNQLVKENI